mmetsp:Transcript_10162/g.21298  ORF Transcript_10162/g.21298 Transcript_10162/m.21298 type:complete len:130 (-) Transcript_10162:95-484(-)
MATPIVTGAVVAGLALAGRSAVLAGSRLGFGSFGASARAAAAAGGAARHQFPKVPRAFAGGFEAELQRKEALMILGLREGATRDQIRGAHRKLMRLNHPDTGGSLLLATKVNEAKDLLLTSRRGGSIFN